MASSSRPDRPALRWNAVCLDCSSDDFEDMINYCSGLLGWAVADGCRRPSECAHDGGHWAKLRDPGGGVDINIQAEQWYEPPVWPERPPAQTKMLHFEIEVDDVEAAVAAAIAPGARVALQQPDDRDPSTLRVMLDPAGHPFCLWT